MAARKRLPFEFVLEALSSTPYRTNPMFGCTAVYVEEKIVLILRDKAGGPDNGVWVATTHDHHDSLRNDLPSIQSITVFGDSPTGWQNIPSDGPHFESEALRACELVLERDPRIGKVPAKKKPRIAVRPVLKKKVVKKKVVKKKVVKKKVVKKKPLKRKTK